MTVPLESSLWVTADVVGRERKLIVVFEARKVVVGPWQECELKEFVVKARALAE